MQEEKNLINCHTHTFTGDHVAPELGKKLLPWPLGSIFTVPLILGFFRWWYYKGPYKWRFGGLNIILKTTLYNVRSVIARNFILKTFSILVTMVLDIDVLLIIYHRIMVRFVPYSKWPSWIEEIRHFMIDNYLLPADRDRFMKIILLILVILLVPTGRKLLIFIFGLIPKFLKILPGPETKKFIQRYLSIGRFTFHGEQETIFKTLEGQYPKGTKFVILPMDFDFIGAGNPGSNYPAQLSELKILKNKNQKTAIPFVFADPRRIAKFPGYLQLIKDCIEKDGFRGIKTYPALGYYPFDKDLLPLMLYACENEIPVLNHCIRGVIFYRGNKKKEWDHHPLFIQSSGKKGISEPLQLFEKKNIDFSTNFTHPLNYLCLLDELRLRRLVAKYNDANINQLFGFTNIETPLKKDLKNLKVCFGHFGGEDEWAHYLDKDRYQPDNSLMLHPDRGIDFTNDNTLAGIWKYTSWYSIIYSLMLQYKNVYADISYIIHDPAIFHLLRRTLMAGSGICDRVLFGTDFYVVRTQKSDKELWTDIVGALSHRELQLIAVDNPRAFLYNKIGGWI